MFTAQDHRRCRQCFLNGPLGIQQLLNIDSHFPFKHPCLAEVKGLGAVEVSHDEVEFSLNQSRHGHAPLDGGREFDRQYVIFNADLTSTREKEEAFVERCTGVVQRCVLDAQRFIVAKFNSNFSHIVQTVCIRDRNLPANLLRGFESHHGLGEEVLGWFKRHEGALGWRSGFPACMAIGSGSLGDGKPCEVGSFQKHSPPLSIVIDRVVHGHVDGPQVLILVGIEQRLLVLHALGDPVCKPAVGTVIASFQPCVCGERFVAEPTHVVEREGNCTVHVFVGIGIQFGGDIQQRGSFAVNDEPMRRCVERQIPILARSCLIPHVQFSRKPLWGIDEGVIDLS